MRSIGSICGIWSRRCFGRARERADVEREEVLPVGLTAFTASRTQPLLEVGGLELEVAEVEGGVLEEVV